MPFEPADLATPVLSPSGVSARTAKRNRLSFLLLLPLRSVLPGFTWFYLEAEANAFAVALMIASDVMVALLVVSTPLTLCLEMIFAGVSVIAE